ncbi:MAG: hypothetical protein H7321_00420, partial [Bacteroidia bacterium]|nr:hypothetical protein [Bacteroidia bacterium]
MGKFFLNRKKVALIFSGFLVCILLTSHTSDEGMFPLSLLDKVNFKKAGFKISQTDVYNP